LEYYQKEGLEVLLMGEPIDNFLMMNLREFQEKQFELIDEDETDSKPAKSKDEEDRTRRR
jgi:HSP90 family molecular chaperone